MNLSGSLAAFELPDVLALLSTTGKSGRLRLTRTAGSDRRTAVIGLSDGRIAFATADQRRSALLRRLSAYGDDEFWAGAAELPDANRLAASLVEGGWVDPAKLEELVRDTALDALVELLHWPDGEFEFLPADADDQPRLVDLDVQAVLTEARRRDASSPALGASAPRADEVLALPLSVPDEVRLDRDEWALLALVDGSRTAADIADLAGRDADSVRTALGELISRGLLVGCDDGRSPVAALRHRLREVQAIEARAASAQRQAASEAPAAGASDDQVEKVPLKVSPDGPWQPSTELAELAVPVDRDAVMRLIVGVQGL